VDKEETYPCGRKKRPQRLCKKCGRRKARQRSNTVCDPCLLLVTAENTFELYDIPREPIAVARMKQRAKAYNKLILAGKTMQEIADAWGYTKSGLASLMTGARAKGIDVVKIHNHTLDPLPKQASKDPRANGHGGGKYGVTGCGCEPCVTVRRKTRRDGYASRKVQPSE
jgi:DNA-binding CsgD family transcriptional regulator